MHAIHSLSPTDELLIDYNFGRPTISCQIFWTYHIMGIQMIVLCIEENIHTHRYVQNVGMEGTINQETRVKHMVLLIRY